MCFLYNISIISVYISVLHCYGEILACSTLLCCFSSLRFVEIRSNEALFRSHHSISMRLRSGLLLGQFNALVLFFFRHSVVGLLLCLGSLSCWWPSFSQALAVGQVTSIWLHNTLVHRGVHGVQAPWLQNKPK